MRINNFILLTCSAGLVFSLPYAPIKGLGRNPSKHTSFVYEEKGPKDDSRTANHIDCSKYFKNDEDDGLIPESDYDSEGSGSWLGSDSEGSGSWLGSDSEGSGSWLGSDTEGSGSGYGPYDDEDLYILCRNRTDENKETGRGEGVSPYSPKSLEPELSWGLDPFHHGSDSFDLDFGLKPLNPEDAGDSIGVGIAPVHPKNQDTTTAVGTNPGSVYDTATTIYSDATTKTGLDPGSTAYPHWQNGGVDHSRTDKESFPRAWWKNLDQHWKSFTSNTRNAADSVRNNIHSWFFELHKKIPEILDDIKRTISRVGLTIHRGVNYVLESISQGFDNVRAQELKKKLNQRLKEGNKIVEEFLQKVGEKVNSWVKNKNRRTVNEEVLDAEAAPNFFQDQEIHQRLDRMVSEGILVQEEADRLYSGQSSEESTDNFQDYLKIESKKERPDSSIVAGNAKNEVDDSYYTAKGFHSRRRPTNQDKFHLKEIYFPA